MNSRRIRLSMLALLCITILTSACQPAKPASLSNEQIGKVADNILVSINQNDYQGFIKDFSDQMITAFAEGQFADLRTTLQGTSGNYISCQTDPTLSNQQDYAVYQYKCKFEKEDVVVTLVFPINGDKVDGLYFNSEALRAIK
jgi:Protein of unknown function (DUF3887)